MFEITLVVIGLALVVFCWKFPHYRTESLIASVVSILGIKASTKKLRLDLPKTTELLWKVLVEPQKLPLVLNERNGLILTIIPMVGDRLSADIEVPIASTADLKNLSVEVITATLDVEKPNQPLTFSLSTATEKVYVITPRVAGDGQIRFEFWQGDTLRGRIEKTFKIKSSQYVIPLPANLTLTLKFVGILCSAAGAILGLVKLLRR